ncbi:hypothetical protein HCH_04538 [Hahella chejuensis KCTC 2396]|uniref:Uncharacterized protein n=1 Tax=Hahella chejuensis (strain KCTC 2396) TaxID=349521 RepID=Q2SDN6_HAHCH|nr:hypothetical protein [Hahella chejuensis]ABC31238.1 hypothetical protein HCH_04538 [Hahella chejuensis KCTC 2396]
MAWNTEKLEKELCRYGVPKGVMDYFLEKPDLGYVKIIEIMDKRISDNHLVNGLAILNELILRKAVEPDIEKVTGYFVTSLEIENAEKVTYAGEQFVTYLMRSLLYIRLQSVAVQFQQLLAKIKVNAPVAYERHKVRVNLAYKIWVEKNA